MSKDKNNSDNHNGDDFNDESFENEVAPLNLEDFMEMYDRHFETLSASGPETGKIYLESCEAISTILKEAKANKLLSQIKPGLLKDYNICHASCEKMKKVDFCWGSRSNGEKGVFCRKYNEKNKSKLDYLSGVAVKKALGKKKVGNFVDFRVDTRTDKIHIEIQGSSELVDFDQVTGKALKALVVGTTKATSQHKRKKAGETDTIVRQQAKIFRDLVEEFLPEKYAEVMASRNDWDSVFVKGPDSDIGDLGSPATGDNSATDLALHHQGAIGSDVDGSSEPKPEIGDTTTLVLHSSGAPQEAIVEIIERIAEVVVDADDDVEDQHDIEVSVGGNVEASDDLEGDGHTQVQGDVEDNVAPVAEVADPDDGDDDAESSNQDLEHLFSLDFDMDSNPDELDESDFDIVEIPMAANAQKTGRDVQREKRHSTRNIAASNGASSNTPYAGGSF